MTHLLIALGWTLIHFCWQAAAIAAVFGAGSLVLARSSSQARYLAALGALLAMMTAAAGTFTWELSRVMPGSWHAAAVVDAGAVVPPPVPVPVPVSVPLPGVLPVVPVPVSVPEAGAVLEPPPPPQAATRSATAIEMMVFFCFNIFPP